MKTVFSVILFLSSLSWAIEPTSIKNTEIQWSLCENSSANILNKLNQTVKSSADRLVSYFDDRTLTFYHKGIQIRKRGNPGDFELTAKVQYQVETEIPWDWIKDKNYKCELDAISTKSILACSIDSKFILDQFLDQAQQELVYKHNPEVDLKQLIEFGPVKNKVWKFIYETGDLTLEQIDLPNSKSIYELSIRVSKDQTVNTKSQIENLLSTQQIHLCAEQKGKTIQVLSAFVGPTIN